MITVMGASGRVGHQIAVSLSNGHARMSSRSSSTQNSREVPLHDPHAISHRSNRASALHPRRPEGSVRRDALDRWVRKGRRMAPRCA
jgi:hypothetical protein